MADTQAPPSPVLNQKEAAAYLRTTPGALKKRRHRRKGPRSFLEQDTRRVLYYLTDLDEYLADSAQADSRSNPELSPLTQAPELRRSLGAKRSAKACAA
ncbi:DNA-binding protein [Embleya sp. NPDC005971]|uniref:DNA-binding protein n=1 Tax=Embleya sp. NPDC005971 TaxID=3156724 RepID=UPI0033F04C0A